jgi:hypothetical protein
LLRKVVLLASVAALFGGSLFISGSANAAGPPPVDATHYKITCDTLLKGSAKFKPPLHLGGTTTPALTQVKGTLSGCTATPDGTNPAVTVVSGGVSGVINGANNDCLALLGPSTATGTLTIKWKTSGDQKMTSSTTVITITSGDISGGTATPFGDSATYGQFNINNTTQTGPFGGPSGTGAASFTKSLTAEGLTSLGAQCGDPVKGLKQVTLGSTETSLG